MDYPLQIRATGNPDPDAWIKQLVDPDLGVDGIPLPERKDNPKTRYFVNSPSGIKLYDSLSIAEGIHGAGDESGIMSFMFQPGNIYSNPVLMEQDPSYVSRLKALPRCDMERLLLGSWTSRETSSGFFKRDWCGFVDQGNHLTTNRVRAWDLAATAPSESSPNPDYTAGVLMSRGREGVVTVEDAVRIQDRPHKVRELIFDTAALDGPEVIIGIPLDPGATAGAYCRQLQKDLSEKGYIVKLVKPDKAKLQRFRPFAAVAEARFVNVVRDAPWTRFYLDELEAFTGMKSRTHDDLVDATSDCFYLLNREQHICTFSLPDLSSPAAFSFS